MRYSSSTHDIFRRFSDDCRQDFLQPIGWIGFIPLLSSTCDTERFRRGVNPVCSLKYLVFICLEFCSKGRACSKGVGGGECMSECEKEREREREREDEDKDLCLR